MSIAGARSNRGDYYQTLVALDWALTVLTDPEYEWLEIDSTTHLVDDVVIGKSDDTVICCQCKKNHPDFKFWSIANLSDELDKVIKELTEKTHVQAIFYSRCGFGELAKLHEFSLLHASESDYLNSLTKEHKTTNSSLAAYIAKHTSKLTTYEFLQRTSFEVTSNYNRMQEHLHERLRQIASNSKIAYNALFTSLNGLSARIENDDLTATTQFRLTKEDLKDILHHCGSILTPSIDISAVKNSFASASAIGRNWIRDIAGQHIPTPIVDELLAAVDTKQRSVLLTGAPGSGKTCTMLSLQEELEQRMKTSTDLVALFIQSREFADLATAQGCQTIGLPAQWMEQASRLADNMHVVIVIDSLDVLSIAREHSILSYFLAQIDRLLMVPNITVITACRDFDRKYDRRIADRTWDCEIQCSPLDWEREIKPALNAAGIDTEAVDQNVRKLISNPRELALFVELAIHKNKINVVSSQELGQLYIDTLVKNDPSLGSKAVQAIESIANIMLESRSLSVPTQRFSASDEILRRLLSLNILLKNSGGTLTFGHQTLLDVLVVSGALRQGISLNEFIRNLTPVPFVRPAIRSFVEQLAAGDRREYKKQIRTVLTSGTAFHIRRLVAESFAQQAPHDDDWSMVRDLYINHREMFQAIYTQATSVEWHHFWLSYLVPFLKEEQDADGLSAHIHRIARWTDEDAKGVLDFWTEMLNLNWLDSNITAQWLSNYHSNLPTESLSLAAPLLKQLLDMPKNHYSSLGGIVSRAIGAGVIDDNALWSYIAGDITDEDVLAFNFNEKLSCKPNEFGGKDNAFLTQRMVQSTDLLDLALNAIEKWNRTNAARYRSLPKKYRRGFLNDSSYQDAHTKNDHNRVSSIRILLDAVEEAILNHAQAHSDWWQENRDRLCFNQEGTLVYFAVRALTINPKENVVLIGRVLSDKDLLEFDLPFELGKLIQAEFLYLDRDVQDSILETIPTLFINEQEVPGEIGVFELKRQAFYISNIPCYLRTFEAQSIVDTYEKNYGILDRKPHIRQMGGVVTAPFSYEQFLNASDTGVLQLLAHYVGVSRNPYNFLIGGEREVGMVLSDASSRQPVRFLRLLTSFWNKISPGFCNDIMDGIASYLSRRYGSTHSDTNWEPIEEPEALTFVNKVIDEIERHSSHWRFNRSASKALEACAHIINDTQNAERLVFLTIGYLRFREESSVSGNSTDLITVGINMVTGNIVEALMILANSLLEKNIEFPELLEPTLKQFANNEHPAIKALILRRLPYFQSKNPKLGWELFELAMQSSEALWGYAEKCLYYAYQSNFEVVSPLLERILNEGSRKDLESWGRISALSALSEYIELPNLLEKLKVLNSTDAWKGATTVWCHFENIKQHRKQCLKGISDGLAANNGHSLVVAKHIEQIFRETDSPILLPIELIQLYFTVIKTDSHKNNNQIFGLDEWLNAVSQRGPDLALVSVELYLGYLNDRPVAYFYDHDNQLVQLITRLFAEAEEREEADNGEMLKRVVK